MERRKKCMDILEKAKSELRLIPAISPSLENIKEDCAQIPVNENKIGDSRDVRSGNAKPIGNKAESLNMVMEQMLNCTGNLDNNKPEQEHLNECYKDLKAIKWENVIGIDEESNLNDALFEGTSFANIFHEPYNTAHPFEYRGELPYKDFLAFDKKFSRLLRQEAERKNIQNSQHSRICLSRKCSMDTNYAQAQPIPNIFGTSSTAESLRQIYKAPCRYGNYITSDSDSESETVIAAHCYKNILSDSESNIEMQKSEATTVRTQTSRDVFLSAAMLKEETHQSRAMGKKYEPYRGVYVPYPSADFERGAFRRPENQKNLNKLTTTNLRDILGPIPNESSTADNSSSNATLNILFKQDKVRSSNSSIKPDEENATNSNPHSVRHSDDSSSIYSMNSRNETTVPNSIQEQENSSVSTDSNAVNESKNKSTIYSKNETTVPHSIQMQENSSVSTDSDTVNESKNKSTSSVKRISGGKKSKKSEKKKSSPL